MGIVILAMVTLFGSTIWVGGISAGPGRTSALAQGNTQGSEGGLFVKTAVPGAGVDEAKEPNYSPYFWAAGIAAAVILVALFSNRCPSCHEFRALYKTGAEGVSANGRTKQEKWRCKYCGFDEWKDEATCGGGCCG